MDNDLVSIKEQIDAVLLDEKATPLNYLLDDMLVCISPFRITVKGYFMTMEFPVCEYDALEIVDGKNPYLDLSPVIDRLPVSLRIYQDSLRG